MAEHQLPYMQHSELIAQCIGRYADLLGVEQVMAKLAALSQSAALASARYR